jgi:O-antigen ligase
MLCALVATGILIRLDSPSLDIKVQSGRWRLHLAWLLLPIFSIIVVAAMSRAGWALLLPALAISLLISIGRRRLLSILMLCGLIIVAVGAAVLATGSLSREAQDVQAILQDNRLISMPDVMFTLQQFWPVGSGLGTFVPVFKANENLDLVTSLYLNHAHNDVLELLIETGILGAILLAIAVVLVLVRLWKVFRRGSGSEVTAVLGGAGILAILLLHSLVDYPIRADAIAAVAGLAAGLLVTRAEKIDAGRNMKRSSRRSHRGFGSPAAVRGS